MNVHMYQYIYSTEKFKQVHIYTYYFHKSIPVECYTHRYIYLQIHLLYCGSHTGTAVIGYSHWAPNQPDSVDARCAAIHSETGSTPEEKFSWDDVNCDVARSYICKYSE